MSDDPKLKKIVDFYFPELFSHFRGVAEHRLPSGQYSIVKKLFWPYTQAADKPAYLARLRQVNILEPANQLIDSILTKVGKGETRLSHLLANIEVDSERLVQVFEKIFRDIPMNRIQESIGVMGVIVDVPAPVTVAPKVRKPTTPSQSQRVTATAKTPDKTSTLPTDGFTQVRDFIRFFRDRRVKKQQPPGKIEHESKLGSIDDETLNDFREEVLSYLDSMLAALRELDKNPSSALSEIRLSARGLATASRVLQIDRLTQLCQQVARSTRELENESDGARQLSTQAVRDFVRSLRLFVEENPISWSDVEKAVAGWKTILPSPEPVVTKPKIQTTEKRESPANGKAHWIDEIQTVLDHHYPQSSILTQTAPTERVEEPPVFDLAETKEEKPAVEIPKPVRRETPKPVAPKPVETGTVAATNALLALMASEDIDADIDKIPMPTFMEKLSEEPHNLARTGKVKTRRIVKKTKKIQKAKVVEAPVPPDGQYVVRELNYANVDPEILDIFEQESADYLNTLRGVLDKLQHTPDTAVKELERTCHTLKSSARMLGFEKISGIAACMELIAERYFEKEIQIDEVVLTLIRDMLEALELLFKRNAASVDRIVTNLLAIEARLDSPNTFVRHIVTLEGAEKTAEAKAAITPTQAPVLEQETPQTETTDYFASTGVDMDIIQIFKEESASYLTQMTSTMTRLRENADADSVRGLEKAAHSLRSSAKMLGFDKISQLARAIEEIAEKATRGRMKLNADAIRMVDAACTLLRKLAEGRDVQTDEVVRQLDAIGQAADGSTPEEPMQAVRTSESKSPAKKKKKIVTSKTKKTKFADVDMASDPILKRLALEQEPLLEEMAHSNVP